ncbi:basic proline-rich protein-like [Diachasmimorpha longicaudata]|uniref:basic proline-rich protein-like n=1 Tax=Diachasmimorpha longicaudata TaxID=58733 RepID=UPI0030B8A18C
MIHAYWCLYEIVSAERDQPSSFASHFSSCSSWLTLVSPPPPAPTPTTPPPRPPRGKRENEKEHPHNGDHGPAGAPAINLGGAGRDPGVPNEAGPIGIGPYLTGHHRPGPYVVGHYGPAPYGIGPYWFGHVVPGPIPSSMPHPVMEPPRVKKNIAFE